MSNNELEQLLSSDATDDDKRQQLIDATLKNQDNHSVWLVHVKDIVKEEGDEKLENEEQTSRCNVLNIMPVVASDSDVQIADENDDVVMVSAPIKTKKKQIPFLKWVIAAILCLVILVAACFVLFGGDDKKDDEKDKIERIKPKQVKSSRKDMQSYATPIKDSNEINSNDTARNK